MAKRRKVSAPEASVEETPAEVQEPVVEAEVEPVEVAEVAAPDPVVAAEADPDLVRFPYRVCKGKGQNTLRGVLGSFEKIGPLDLPGGEKQLADLEAIGTVEKR